MKAGNWVALDKRLAHFLPQKRPYSILEAMFSYSKDLDENKENTIHGYSRIWSWSRTKVRRFISDLKTSARHEPDRDETGTRQEIRLINNDLRNPQNHCKTTSRPPQDQHETITINPNPDPIPYREIIEDLNCKGGFRYQVSDSSKQHIKARFSEGFTKEDFFKVHDIKIDEWQGTQWAKFLRPKTLYLPDNFQAYLNQSPPRKTKTIMGPDGMEAEVPDDDY